MFIFDKDGFTYVEAGKSIRAWKRVPEQRIGVRNGP
jgi:hypothetical protein